MSPPGSKTGRAVLPLQTLALRGVAAWSPVGAASPGGFPSACPQPLAKARGFWALLGRP